MSKITLWKPKWLHFASDGEVSVDMSKLYDRKLLDNLSEQELDTLASEVTEEFGEEIQDNIDKMNELTYGAERLFIVVAILKDNTSRAYTFETCEERDEYVECLTSGAVKDVEKLMVVDSNLGWTEVEYEQFYKWH